MTDWLTAEAWEQAQRQLPIACVDLLATGRLPDGSLRVGLIRRTTPHQGERWCLIGGRVRRGERLLAAAKREWSEALGESLPFAPPRVEPHVVEYLPWESSERPHDPRKHAISATYVVEAPAGLGAAQGPEALAFAWFDPAEVTGEMAGFGQDVVIADLLVRLGLPGPT